MPIQRSSIKVATKKFTRKKPTAIGRTRSTTVAALRRPVQRRSRRRKKTVSRGTQTKTSRAYNALSLTAPNYYTKQASSTFVGNGSNITGGLDPYYFVGNTTTRGQGASQINALTTFTVDDALAIANAINAGELLGAGTLNQRFYFQGSVSTYQYMNACNAPVTLETWECMIRNDIPFVSGVTNLYSMLSDGWIQAGITDANTRLDITPYQSPLFCENIKIGKHRKVVIQPGQTSRIVLRQKHKFRVNAGKYVAPADETSTFLTGAQLYMFIKGGRFLVHRFWCGAANVSSGSATLCYPPGELMCTYSTRIEYKHILDEKVNIVETIPLNSYAYASTSVVMNPLTATPANYVQL